MPQVHTPGEEIICSKVHLNLKKKYKYLLTIIIPRHIHRVNKIIKEIKTAILVVTHSSNPKNFKNTDIYLVDTYKVSYIIIDQYQI